ncbi:MAG TPA: tetratricopeptide repeat protein [Thermoanaerobaculia bacterium]|jgi:Flp pilus assembly protein TadD|nr:tetratricopeptide repeat protein [Thermoanaerobaculia bacterium]
MVRRRIQSPAGLSIAAVLVAIVGITAITAFAAVPPNLSKALEAQRRLVTEKPQDAAVHNDLGSLLLLAERTEEAEAAYRRAIELDPDKVSALFNLAQLLQQRKEKREALRLYDRVVELQPNHAWAHYQIGTLHEGWGQESRAVEHYARAFALDPQLAFKEVNPHIVENTLVTQAMLRAYDQSPGPSQAPRYFEDRDRIVNLLVPLPLPEAQQEKQAAEQTEGTDRQGQARPGAAREGQNVLREGDLRNRATGQAVPQGRGGRTTMRQQPTQRGGLRQWERPEPTLQDQVPGEMIEQPDAEPGQVITPPPGGVYYRPGSPSSGRLNIRVMPERDGEARG